ncbi:BQ5605_C010g05832 [Microbotryum silenes-dioicae]|uniref:BQ5605_C010g05832 protein n=1 Tax=Microbotryum silenes-dioicae TaxID=796604 RepID=A0A2X0MAV5_9BASI|nr:BQ5605_C010g05832 [Microbotryum silenes-dioicae]
MSDPLHAYLDLSQAAQESPSVLPKLQRMLQVLQMGEEPVPEVRRRLLAAILSSLQASFLLTSSPTMLTPIASILKLLGRSAAGGEELGRAQALSVLVQLGGLDRVGRLPAPTSRRNSRVLPTTFNVQELGLSGSTSEEEPEDGDYLQGQSDPLFPYECEALRCLCNTLMLHPSSRDSFSDWLRNDPSRKAVRGLLRLLDCDTAGFLSGRVLFLITSKPTPLIVELTENRDTIEKMRKFPFCALQFADRYLRRLRDPELALSLTTGPMPTPADTLREHLKLAFNIMLQYGRLAPALSQPPLTPVSETEAMSPLSVPDQSDSSTSPASFVSTDSSSYFDPVRDTSDVDDDLFQPQSEGAQRFGSLGSATTELAVKEKKGRFRWSGMSKRSISTTTEPSSDEGESLRMPGTSGMLASATADRRFSKTSSNFGREIREAVGGSPGSSTRSPSPSPTVTQSSLSSHTSTPRRDTVPPNSENGSSGMLTLESVRPFLPLFRPCLTLACCLGLGDDPQDPNPLVRGALNTLLNFPIELEEFDGLECSWLQPVPESDSLTRVTTYCTRRSVPRLPPLPGRLMEILAMTCNAWFPVDKVPLEKTLHDRRPTVPASHVQLPAHPDDLLPRGTGGESAKVDEILGPVMLLLRKVSMLAEPAEIMREILLPDDMRVPAVSHLAPLVPGLTCSFIHRDRSLPLEQRSDLTGHLVRLLSSLLLPNTAYGVGEFLYNLCDRDPAILSTQIGYGNASGFLQNRGELIPPPPIHQSPQRNSRRKSGHPISSVKTSDGTAEKDRPWSTLSSASTVREEGNEINAMRCGPRIVNPITGAFELPPEFDTEDEMTEEEKEREAEKLYVLFDRMQRTGVMDVENPIRKARGEGKLEETTDELEAERKRLDEEDARVEKEVETEMANFKLRKRGGQELT